jgi:cofilin
MTVLKLKVTNILLRYSLDLFKSIQIILDSQWDELIQHFPNDDVRYAVADVHFNSADGQRTEMVFLSWAPETASVKRRMLMASSKDALKNTLVGCKHSVQACCYPDLDLKTIADKFKGTVE